MMRAEKQAGALNTGWAAAGMSHVCLAFQRQTMQEHVVTEVIVQPHAALVTWVYGDGCLQTR